MATLNERQLAFLAAMADGVWRHSALVFMKAFPEAPYRGRRDAGATRTLDSLKRLGFVKYEYIAGGQQPSRRWCITDAGREAIDGRGDDTT